MDLITDIHESDLVGIKLIAESSQFAIYATGVETYLLVQRHAGMPWTGVRVSGDAVFRVTSLLTEATRDLYRDLATHLSPINRPEPAYESRVLDSAEYDEPPDTATERRDLYADDLTEERQISPVKRDILAANIVLDPDIA
jgi:hypothetical protein